MNLDINMNVNMKKKYINPTVEYIQLPGLSIMTTTSPVTAPEDGDGGRGNDGFQTGEHRGDWDNIWQNM